MSNSTSPHEGSILRIATKELADFVFDMAIYFTNMKPKWNTGHVIIFVSKTDNGDAFVGYGVVDGVRPEDDLYPEERAECERGGWTNAIEFKYVKRFKRPLLIKETFFKDTKVRGRCFQGFRLNREQIEQILSFADISFTKSLKTPY